MRHAESLREVGNVSISLTGAYHTVEIEVTTSGKVKKLLTLTESEASALCAALADALDKRPTDRRAERFHASIRATAA